MTEPIVVVIDQLAKHVDVEPGDKIVFHGSYHSSFDGSEIDAATTTWPEGAPGGSSVDAGGLLDLAAGGFHLLARDPKTHEVTAVATGKEAPACAAAHVASPCLAVRTISEARTRMLTVDDWTHSLDGRITAEILVPPPAPAYAVVTEHAATPYVAGGLVIAAALGAGFALRARHKRSPLYLMRLTLRRLEQKLKTADAALSAALTPALARVREVLERRRIDPKSTEGARIASVLRRVEERLDDSLVSERAAKEQEAADELVIEMESALEAAHEVMRTGARLMTSAAVDLNIDLGELPGESDAFYALATIVNIACGGHAGDEASMRGALESARRSGARVAGHPSYPDREGFGRRARFCGSAEVAASVEAQLATLARLAGELGIEVATLKLHGALYHDAAVDEATAREVLGAAQRSLPRLSVVVGPPRGALAPLTATLGITYAPEGFADRRYLDDDRLAPRSLDDALVTEPSACAAQALKLARTGRFATLCVHSDTPNALASADAVRRVLATEGLLRERG